MTFDINLDGENLIDAALDAVRQYFDMPVAYISRFDGDYTVFRNVSAPGLENLIKQSDQKPLAEVYCPHILANRLPNLIPDTSQEPICQDMAITAEVPIGSHVSLPIAREDGTTYGMFCCLSPEPNATLNERDLSVMSSFLSLVTRQVRREERAKMHEAERRAWIDDLLFQSSFRPVFQPIVNLSNNEVVGIEALSRFDADVNLGVEEIFQKVDEAGLGLELELVTLAKALESYLAIDPAAYIALNASPELICDDRFMELLPEHSMHRLVVELTEHSEIEDMGILIEKIADLRSAGVRLAIDDVGTGYSGLLRIAQLQPDLLKIDRSIVAGISKSRGQKAMVSALVHFATETGCQLLGEGVEDQNDAHALRELGVELAQGWLYARPKPLAEHDMDLRTA